MPKYGRTKLVPQSMELPEEQSLEVTERSRFLEQRELDNNKIECPRCNDIMELNSSFDALMYSCENCSFLLKCI
jgi:hypothetical protein